MATHSSILAWRIPTDGGAWQAGFSPWGCKESGTTERRTVIPLLNHKVVFHISDSFCFVNRFL